MNPSEGPELAVIRSQSLLLLIQTDQATPMLLETITHWKVTRARGGAEI